MPRRRRRRPTFPCAADPLCPCLSPAEGEPCAVHRAAPPVPEPVLLIQGRRFCGSCQRSIGVVYHPSVLELRCPYCGGLTLEQDDDV